MPSVLGRVTRSFRSLSLRLLQRKKLQDVKYGRSLRSLSGWASHLLSGLYPIQQTPAIMGTARRLSTMGISADKAQNSRHHKVHFDDTKLYVPWEAGGTSTFHHIWLRDCCHCPECLHPVTKQRQVNTFDIPPDIKPEAVECLDNYLEVKWKNDGHVSHYPWDWLHRHSYHPVLEKPAPEKRVLWGAEISKSPPVVEYKSVMKSSDGLGKWLDNIRTYGFSIVEGVPATAEATKELAERIAFIRNTHYGGFWEVEADMSKKDTAYSTDALSVHTDGSYFSDPPGLQLFHMLRHEGSGGESVFVDGFKAARILREEDTEAYKLLSKVVMSAHSAGNEDVCIRPKERFSILRHDRDTQELFQIRWNNDDRSTMSKWSDSSDVEGFYRAIRVWHKILTRPEMEYRIQLQPGSPLIFDNWRILHGRTAFTGNRLFCGAYINRDDYISKLHLSTLGRDQVLKSL